MNRCWPSRNISGRAAKGSGGATFSPKASRRAAKGMGSSSSPPKTSDREAKETTNPSPPGSSPPSRLSSSLRTSLRLSLPGLLDPYLHQLEARGLARETILHRKAALRFFADWLAERRVTDVRRVVPADVAAYQLHVASYRYRSSAAPEVPLRPLAPKTRYERLAVLRDFFGWLCRERVILVSPFAAISLKHPRRSLPKPVLTEHEVLSLFAAVGGESAVRPACAGDVAAGGLRNRAILEILYGSGLRRAEVAALDVADLDLAAGTMLVRNGKGGRSRIVPIGEPAAEPLAGYLRTVRPRWLRHRGTTALFLGANTGRRLSKGTIGIIVRKIAKAAGLEGKATPHALRHACATHMLRNGADIRHIQELLGHADIGTTQIYTHVAIKDLLEVHARCHPRGRQR